MAPTSWETECNAHIAWAEMLVGMMHPLVLQQKQRVVQQTEQTKPNQDAEKFKPAKHHKLEQMKHEKDANRDFYGNKYKEDE